MRTERHREADGAEQEAGARGHPEHEGLLRTLDQARATIEALESELEHRRALDEREAYRFARTLVEVKADPRQFWRIPLAFLALLTPKPIRERARKLWSRVGSRKIAHLIRDRFIEWRRARRLARDLETTWLAGQPLVSVVVPCFNYGRYIRDAVDSLLRQTLTDLEVIIVEGGSTDGRTPDMVRSMEHPKVRKLFQQGPTRVGDNRLAGLRIARGKYVVFFDPDDVLEPTYLEKCVMVLELTGVDIAYPMVQAFDRDSWLWQPASEFTLEKLGLGDNIPTVSMFRIETWSRLGIGYGTHLDVEDYDFWLRFAAKGARGFHIREPLMLYRVHGSSLTDAIRHKHDEAIRRIWHEHRHSLTPWRVKRATGRQRDLSFRPGRQANLARLGANSRAELRIALAVPWLVVGGSDHLMLQVFADHAARKVSLLVYTTLEPPPGMGSSVADYARLTRDVFELPKELPPAAHPEAILHLLQSRGVNVLMIVGSRTTYELLPRIKSELPHVKVVDHLYNTVGHLGSNREFAGHIDFHIVANEEVRQALLARGESPGRIEVIHHGIDTASYCPDGVARRDDLPGLPLGSKERLVLFAGRFSEEKGALRFVDIVSRMQQMPGLVFAMIGDGPMRPQVDAKARELGLDDRIIRLGFVDDSRPFLRRADVAVIPSDIDGLPLVCLEALSLGTPVVASRIGALPEAIEEGRTGTLVQPRDVDGFVRAIQEVLSWGGGDELARRCRRSVVDRFSIREVRDRYHDVFRRVAGLAPAARVEVP